MGTCMSKKDQVYQPKTINPKKQVANEANLLIDQWNEKHIEILKQRFQESLQKEKKMKMQGLDKQAFMKVFADLKTFPKQVAESAFKLFDRDRSGFIDFREFCVGLSIICLSSPNEKIRFVFDLFDLDRDGFLNKQELRMLLETSVMSFRKFCKGPGDQIDKMWIEHHFKIISGNTHGLNGLNQEQRIDFFTFKSWAEKNLNVYHLLNTFELVPSPVKERKTILEILQHYERKHGDTMYALSYRWWDMWKQYTSQHQSTKDQSEYIELVKESVSENASSPDFIRNFIMAYYEEQKDGDINEAMERQDFMDYRGEMGMPGHGMVIPGLKKEISKAKLTPRSGTAGLMIDKDILRDEYDANENSLILESSRKSKNIQQINMNMKVKETLASKRQLNYSSTIPPRDEQGLNKTGPESAQDSPHIEPKRLDSKKYGSQINKNAPKSNRLKQLNAKIDVDVSMNPISSQPSVIVEEENNDLRISQSFKFFAQHQVDRPLEIDNSDIEGEHPSQLKPNLILHRDFIIIPEEAWKCLMSWYGGGPSFPRKVIINNTIPTIELYPPLITSVLADKNGQPVQDSERTLFVSVAMKLSEVFLKICESFNYISTKDTRLWFREGGKEWILIDKNDLEKNLEEFIVKDGDVFMVEVKFGEKWPRDNPNGGQQDDQERDWKNFQVGDKIDISDNNEWKIGRIVRVFKDKLKVHLINEHWKNDIIIAKDSQLIDRYGEHTFQIHFKNSNQLKSEDIPSDFSGIENIGNTCYINAILQALFHTPLFREFFTSNSYIHQLNLKKSTSQSIVQNGTQTANNERTLLLAQAFGELFQETMNKSLVIPATFKKVVSSELPMFFGYQQHDSQEFLSFFLDKISEDLNRIEEEGDESGEEAKQKDAQQNQVESSSSKQIGQNDEESKTNTVRNNNLLSSPPSAPFQIEPSANEDNSIHSERHEDGGTGGMKFQHSNNDMSGNSRANMMSQEIVVQDRQSNMVNAETPKNTGERGRISRQSIENITAQDNTKRGLIGSQAKTMTTNEHIYNTFFQPNMPQSKRSALNSPQKEKENALSNYIVIFNHNSDKPKIPKPLVFSNKNISPLLLDPNISEPERKAIEAWEREMRVQNSAVSDLFVGQQGTTVQCQQCRNRTYAFENFYTLSLPLPYNHNAIFYITVMKRSTQYMITPIIKYGIQIDKNAKLLDLVTEVENLSRLSINKMLVVEVCNNKIYRQYDDMSINLRSIYRRTNELVIYEYLSRPVDLPIQPKKMSIIKDKQRSFKALTEIKIGMILDAQDVYSKWYVGIVVDREFDYDQNQFSVKVHFYEFPERWDEWYKDENINKLAPFGTHTEEPKEKIYFMPMMHRKIINNDNSNRIEHQIIGTPFYLSIGNWYTWEETYVEVVNQAFRFIRNLKYNGTKSQRSIQEENENISDEDMGEEKSSKLYKYDSSYFSKKMQDVDKKGKNQEKETMKTPLTMDHKRQMKEKMSQQDLYSSKTPGKNAVEEMQMFMEKKGSENQGGYQSQKEMIGSDKYNKISKSSQSHRIVKYSKVQKSFNEGIIQTLGNEHDHKELGFDGHEMRRLPFKVCILDAECHLCALCLFKNKYTEQKSKDPVTCKGCDMYQSSDKIKWILGCFKRLEICIDWIDPLLYKNPLITSDMTCLKLLQQEKEIKSGIPLNQCLDLYTKKDQIDDYSCDNCKKSTPAIVDTKVSKAPDILIIHLKRFSYQSGYLEKIEDLVTFPLNNLDISNYMCKFKKKTHNYTYDLYAVVNHIMYHTSGGHYTSYVVSDQPSQTMAMGGTASSAMGKKNELWLKCNDSQISRIDKTDIISKDAYILFYKRRELTASNIINFTAPAF